MKLARVTVEIWHDTEHEPMSDDLTAMVAKYMADHLRSHANHAAARLGRALSIDERVDLTVTVSHTSPKRTK